jgi:solute carrier family 25 citrate transporter 1
MLPLTTVRMRMMMKSYTLEEVKRKHLQVEDNKAKEIRYEGTLDTIRKMYKYEGIKSFYKGATPSVVRIFPSSGLFFIIFEATLSFLSGF